MNDIKSKLIQYIQGNQRICPMPDQWNTLWEMLPGKERVGLGWKPSLPLILAAWSETTDDEKRKRLLVHIDYAAEKGALAEIDKYLRSLEESDWLYNALGVRN